MLGEHGLLKKMTFYEGAVRVPCLLRWPGRVGPRTVPRVLQHVDLAPTLLEALGVAAPEGARLAGRSLVPYLCGERDPDWPELAASELLDRDRLHWMVRDGRYKLVWHGAEDAALYDLALDPHETRNLAGESAGAARVAELRSRFEQLTAGTEWRVGR
jgi:choline-sulfatase